MNWVERFLMLISSVILFYLGIIILGFLSGFVDKSQIVNLLMLSKTNLINNNIVFLIALFLFFLAISQLLSVLAPSNKLGSFFKIATENGEVMISQNSIANYLKSLKSKIEGLKELNPNFKLKGKALIVNCRIVIDNSRDATAVAKDVQENVKIGIADVFGIQNINKVNVFIEKVLITKMIKQTEQKETTLKEVDEKNLLT